MTSRLRSIDRRAARGTGAPAVGADIEPDGPTVRERLLLEAETALRRDGYFGVSIRQVALSAGAHPSTVGYLFGGRAALLKAAEERMRAHGGA